MYEGKFGNREWEQQRGTEEYQYYRTNEYCMLEEINWRSDEDIDEDVENTHKKDGYRYAYIGNTMLINGETIGVRIAIKKKVGTNHYIVA